MVAYADVWVVFFLSLCACFRCLHATEQEVDIQKAEVDDEVSSALSEALDHSNILEYLSGAQLSSRQIQQTPEWWVLHLIECIT